MMAITVLLSSISDNRVRKDGMHGLAGTTQTSSHFDENPLLPWQGRKANKGSPRCPKPGYSSGPSCQALATPDLGGFHSIASGGGGRLLASSPRGAPSGSRRHCVLRIAKPFSQSQKRLGDAGASESHRSLPPGI